MEACPTQMWQPLWIASSGVSKEVVGTLIVEFGSVGKAPLAEACDPGGDGRALPQGRNLKKSGARGRKPVPAAGILRVATRTKRRVPHEIHLFEPETLRRPPQYGGVNRLAPVEGWGRAIVESTQQALKQYDPAEVGLCSTSPRRTF